MVMLLNISHVRAISWLTKTTGDEGEEESFVPHTLQVYLSYSIHHIFLHFLNYTFCFGMSASCKNKHRPNTQCRFESISNRAFALTEHGPIKIGSQVSDKSATLHMHFFAEYTQDKSGNCNCAHLTTILPSIQGLFHLLILCWSWRWEEFKEKKCEL